MGFKMEGLDEVSKMLNDIAVGIDDIAIEAVNEAAPALEASVKSHIQAAANRGYATGATAAGVRRGNAKVNAYGVAAVVSITGSGPDGTRNGEKAAYLEYGTSRQAAHPFIRQSMAAVQESCEATMTRVVEDRLSQKTK